MFVHEVIAAEVCCAWERTRCSGCLATRISSWLNSFVEKQGGRYISAAHEASAVMMAFGYACRTGRTRGLRRSRRAQGSRNTATALIECVRSGTPVLLITGDTAPNNTINQQTLGSPSRSFAPPAPGYVLVNGPAGCRGGGSGSLGQAGRSTQSRPVRAELPDRVPVGSPSIEGPRAARAPLGARRGRRGSAVGRC